MKISFKSTVHVIMLAIVFAVCFVLSKNSFGAEPAGITTGAPTAVYYQMATSIQKTCSAQVALTVHESTGSVSNVERVLTDKRYQYGITQLDALAYKGLSDQRAKDKIKMIMPLHDNDIHLIATPQSGIRNMADLQGKRVIVGPDGSGNWVTSQLIKAKTGLTWEDIPAGPDAGITQLLLGQADAMIFTGGKPVPMLQKIGAGGNGKIRLIPMSHPALDGFYTNVTIPEGMYAWSKTPVHTYGVKNVLVTYDYRAQFQKEIADLTSCIVNNLTYFQETGHEKWREVDPASYKQVKWPVHPVALRYLNRPGR
jgi:TRAP transporter TAXI family solute receptor